MKHHSCELNSFRNKISPKGFFCFHLQFQRLPSLATLLKKRLQHTCFPVIFEIFLRTTFKQKKPRQVLLLLEVRRQEQDNRCKESRNPSQHPSVSINFAKKEKVRVKSTEDVLLLFNIIFAHQYLCELAELSGEIK